MRHLMCVLIPLVIGATPAMAQRDTSDHGIQNSSPFGGWLGIGLSCSSCSLQCQAETCAYTFSEPPTVFSVDVGGPGDRAGLRTGDTLTLIDGWPLTSPDGGKAFGMIRPGQVITFRYRRGGREAEARVTAGVRPRSAEFAAQEGLRARAREEAQRQHMVQEGLAEAKESQLRAMHESQAALEAQREAVQRAMRQMELQRTQVDSARLEAMRRSLRMLDSAALRWRTADSLWARLAPTVTPAGAIPAAPVPSLAPMLAMPASAPAAPVPPLTYAGQRAFGPLRYSGRLADVVIEARSPGAVTTTEVSDSEVVVTSPDLSVRIALRPRLRPTPRPAQTPRPAAPARPARPPEN